MSRVVAWPGAQTPGFINLHWTQTHPRDPSKIIWGGKPTGDTDKFLDDVKWALSTSYIRDIYFCLSRQAESGSNTRGNPKPIRNQANATGLKSIWIDVDIKASKNGYNDLGSALEAIATFTKVGKLPRPSALIGSGGGVHVYWISSKELTPTEWKIYADGLKEAAFKHDLRCDAGCTVDSARVLRVPGTKNYKTVPPKPVKVLWLLEKEDDYDFAVSLSSLVDALEPRREGSVVDLSAFPLRPGKVESLAEGIEQVEHPPLPWAPLVTKSGCGFIRDALVTGGAEYSQPMWNLTTLAATFLEDGHALAHRMGRKHPEYTSRSTDALWDRKSRERKDRGLGWPSCGAVHTAGYLACAGCVHFGKIKSPLNISLTATVTTTPQQTKAASNLMLPPGFKLDKDGYVCKILEITERGGGPTQTEERKLFNSKLSAPFAQKNPPALNFVTTTDLGNTRMVSIPLASMHGGSDMWSSLLSQEVKHHAPNKRFVEEFLVSWISKLNDAVAAMENRPYGWFTEKGNPTGFVYGNQVYKKDGSSHPSGAGDHQARMDFTPMGKTSTWFEACEMMCERNQPELELLIAASFGAPLMRGAGQYAGVISCWGDPGAGKSSAVKVGLAVWGHPKRTKMVKDGTQNSVIQRMGETAHLPLYWDDIQDKENMAKVLSTGHAMTEGIEKTRLWADGSQRARGDWQTLAIICSNLNMHDYIASKQTTHSAGLYRFFEYSVSRSTKPDRLSSVAAELQLQELETNYGMVGIEYAKLLAADPEKILKFTSGVSEDFVKTLGATREERFWTAVCGTVFAGAQLGCQLGAPFHLDKIHEFLVDTFYKLRVNEQSYTNNAGREPEKYTMSMLSRYLNARRAETLYTDSAPLRGKQVKIITVLQPTPPANFPRGVKVQWLCDDLILRISRVDFHNHLHSADVSPNPIMKGLRDFCGMTVARVGLGAGTIYHTLPDECMQIPITPGSDLYDMMKNRGTGNPNDIGSQAASAA